jgi:hypothetical protein
MEPELTLQWMLVIAFATSFLFEVGWYWFWHGKPTKRVLLTALTVAPWVIPMLIISTVQALWRLCQAVLLEVRK